MIIKAVIFDLDGTLFDSIEDICDANNSMLKRFEYPEHDIDKYIQWIGNGTMKLVKASLPEYAKFDEDSLLNYLAVYENNYTKNIVSKSKIYDGIEGVLDFLVEAQIPFAINTNKPQELTNQIVEKCFKKWYFTTVIGQRPDLPIKPDPVGALNIAQQFGVKPENILFIGDSLVDINTAKNAGMIPLGVSWGYGNAVGSKTMDVAYMIDSPQEIIDFINTKKDEDEN